MNVKLITGFRKDQEHSIDASEAHKAYYLFLHPEMRGVFSNGLAVTGSDIKGIVPDWNGTMGWNPSHILDQDDWTEIRKRNLDTKMRNILARAKEIATLGKVEDISKKLETIPTLRSAQTKSIGELLTT
jgi:hypothetical protein